MTPQRKTTKRNSPRAAKTRRAKKAKARFKDIDAWFAALDRFADVPFMEDGRNQPPMPEEAERPTARENFPRDLARIVAPAFVPVLFF
jgi:hypothetical protein